MSGAKTENGEIFQCRMEKRKIAKRWKVRHKATEIKNDRGKTAEKVCGRWKIKSNLDFDSHKNEQQQLEDTLTYFFFGEYMYQKANESNDKIIVEEKRWLKHHGMQPYYSVPNIWS